MTIKEWYDISATNYSLKLYDFESGKVLFTGWLSDIPMSYCNFIIKRIWINANESDIGLDVEEVNK